MTENLEKHQEKLEEKQAACLEQIREMEKQVTGTTTLAASRVGLPRGATSQELGGGRMGTHPSLVGHRPWFSQCPGVL